MHLFRTTPRASECVAARVTLDVIVSVYDEAESLPLFHAELQRAVGQCGSLSARVRVIYVDDGSTDGSADILDAFGHDDGVEVLHLSRNFGHEAAMLAGLDHSTADFAILLDADLQHPPEMIAPALAAALDGHDVVLLKRAPRARESPLRGLLTRAFYRGLDAISPIRIEPDVSDFLLVARPVVELLQQGFRERTRFLRGLVQWVGFRRTVLTFTAAPRIAGRSKYRSWRLLSLARDATLAFSAAPLRVSFIAAAVMLLASLAVAALSLVGWWFGSPPSGYTTIMIFITTVAAAQFALLGILGEYVAQLVDEAKGRPIYIVARRTQATPRAADRAA
jgi:polyisoprenyl-phosphate glycosyltransferase